MRNVVSLGIGILLLSIFNGCGDTNSGTTQLDMADYYEQESSVRNIVKIYETNETRESRYSEENVVVDDNVITYEVNNTVGTIVTINSDDINITYPESPSLNTSQTRDFDIGDQTVYKLSSSSSTINERTIDRKEEHECIVESQLTEFVGDPTFLEERYTGDIILEKCTTTSEVYVSDLNKTFSNTDIKMFYMQKGVGQIAIVNRNCYIETDVENEDGRKIYEINDTSSQCDVEDLFTTLWLN